MIKHIVLVLQIVLLTGCQTALDSTKNILEEQVIIEAFASKEQENIAENTFIIMPENEFEEPAEELIDFQLTKRSLLELPEICRLIDRNKDPVRIGFPISDRRLPSSGVVNVQVIFVDFLDYIGTKNAQELLVFFEEYAVGIESFYDFQSGGLVQFEWIVETEFITIPKNISSLNLTRSNPVGLDQVLRQSILIADKIIDYTSTDMVIVFLNPDIPERLANVSPAWPLEGHGIMTNEKSIFNATLIAGDAVRIGYPIIAHEIGHLFGLVDLYDYNWTNNNPTLDEDFQFVFTGVFDFMNLAPSSRYGDNRDMLGWQRWLLNWIDPEEINCLSTETKQMTTHRLSPITTSGNIRILVIRLSSTQALVSEVRAKGLYCEICSGGLYTYIVDTSIRNGNGPIQLLRPEHSRARLYQDAYLKAGEALQFNGVTILVEAKIDQDLIVSITQNNK